MARLEALVEPFALDSEQSQALERLAQRLGGHCQWLDGRNATIRLSLEPGDLPVQVLLEWRPPRELLLLVNSGERMGNGAPLSRVVLDQVLEGLLQAPGGARVRFRSDRDGPIRPLPRAPMAAVDRTVLAPAS
jgi:hypothetical protein